MATAPTPTGEEPEPSMDDILASIRRILDEDQANRGPAEDVLVLDPSMMVEPPDDAPLAPEPAAAPPLVDSMEIAHTEPVIDDAPSPTPVPRDKPATPPPVLVAPEAAAAAASSVGTLMRTLAAERNAVVSRGSVTIEDLVREEIRPLLKDWLDAHLPPIVERMVRAEIERVIGRQSP